MADKKFQRVVVHNDPGPPVIWQKTGGKWWDWEPFYPPGVYASDCYEIQRILRRGR